MTRMILLCAGVCVAFAVCVALVAPQAAPDEVRAG